MFEILHYLSKVILNSRSLALKSTHQHIILLQKNKNVTFWLMFSFLHFSRRNILPNFTNYYISTCRYHPVKNPYCPIFLVDDILQYAEPDFKENEQMILKVRDFLSKKPYYRYLYFF
jgi:hypothetical protein